MKNNYNFLGRRLRSCFTDAIRHERKFSSAFLNMKLGFVMMFFFMLFQSSFGQISVTVNNPTNTTPNLAASYTSLANALTDLNAVSAMSGPVTLTLTGNETAPATGLTIGSATLNSALSAVNNVTFLASGIVTLNAGVGTATPSSAAPDGILKIVGADWITIDGITFTDSNATNPATMEFGLGLFKLSLSDGASNNTIKNCIINMQRINNASGGGPMVEGAIGICMVNSIPTAAVTALSPTTAAGTNSNNKFYSNTINGGNYGMSLIGFAAASPYTAADTSNDVGGNSLATANTILNFGGGAAANASAGIRTLAQYGINISYNTINNNDGSGVNHATTLRGIYLNTAAAASATVNNNTVTVKSGATASLLSAIENASGSAGASNTITISNNLITGCTYLGATTPVISGIVNSATPATSTMNGNTVTGFSIGTVGSNNSVTFHGLYQSGGATNTNMNSNNVYNNTINNQGGTLYCLRAGTTLLTANNNTIYNNSFASNGGTNAAVIYGIYDLSSPTLETIQNNTIYSQTISGNSTSTSSGIYGLYFNTTSTSVKSWRNNTIYGFAYNNASTGSATIYGMYTASGATININKNKIYDLSASGSASTVSGIYLSSGTTINVSNNIIGDLRTPSSNLANPLVGINITGGTTTVNAYYNTVMLSGASTGALFGSSAVSASSTPTVELRNNIFVNNSSVAGAGLAAAYRRSSTTLTSYAAASNNNLFYGSTIFTDGTNTDATLVAYKARVASRDASSIYENPTFISTAGANAQFLHINTATPTLIESSAAPIATYTDDFDGDVRNVSTPDIGADEFAGTPLSTVVINNVTITPLGNQCTAVSRNVTANITAGGNDIISVNLNYSFNGVAQTPIAMTGGTLTAGSTSTFAATIPVAVPVNANVTWNVVATDPLTSKSTSGTSYQDEPLFGTTATANASVSTFCNSGTSVLSATLAKNGTISVGSGALTTSGSGTSGSNYVSPFTHYYGGYKAQYIIRASELTALGFTAGNNLTSLAFDVTTAGTTYNGFTLSMGSTAVASLTTTFETSLLTQVYTGNLNVAATGLLTLPFGTGAGSSTSFVWDGTSNILINFCWSNNNGGGAAAGSAEVKYDTTSFVAMSYFRVDNQTSAALCGTATATATLSFRPKMVLGGNLPPAITNYSWSDGSTVVGTTNNLSVSPTVTTTYTATLTAAGCTVTTNSVVITVNTTAAPTGTSPQTFVPTQTLADLVVAGSNIIWYATPADATAAVNPLPTSTLLVDATTYYATQTISGCTSATSLGVLVQAALSSNQFDLTSFKFYPNPVTNVLNVDYSQKITNVVVYNAVGQEVLVKTPNATSTVINMAHLAEGIYFVKLSTDNATKTIRIVKN